VHPEHPGVLTKGYPAGIGGGPIAERIRSHRVAYPKHSTYHPKGLVVKYRISFVVLLSIIIPSVASALPKQPRNQRKCSIPQARTNPPAEIGRCQCGDFITQFGTITIGTTFCRCTPVYYPPQAPNIPAVDDCAFDTSCTNSGGGPCQKFKYEEDPQRDIPNWAGGVMPKYGVYTSFELFGP